jgi:two-component system, chemotaxis family, sensor kinase CheA
VAGIIRHAGSRNRRSAALPRARTPGPGSVLAGTVRSLSGFGASLLREVHNNLTRTTHPATGVADPSSEPESGRRAIVEDLDDIVAEFLVESIEDLDRLDQGIVELEANPASEEVLASIFRNIHTIKGTSGFFGFTNLESVSHAGENLLSVLREGSLAFSAVHASALLSMCDAVRSMLGLIGDSGVDGDDDHSELVGRLTAMAAADSDATASEPELVPTSEIKAPAVVGIDEADVAVPASGAASDGSIRVDVKRLDTLMNLVGELVLARNQVLQFHSTQGDPNFQATSQQLNLITTELQEEVMKTRMQPIGNIWSKFPRIVRDLSSALGKRVRLRMEGEETELDKTLIEAIKDPLTHIVRNSVDHGIETPADRAAAGKGETGTLTLRALHEGGQVIIQISDDGAGLKLDRIREKAVADGSITAGRAAELSDRDVANLVFRPGLSTADTVTNVSGRGVGMDVVKTNIERIGGTIDIASQPGSGTTLTVRIPLTLAIIPALIISTDGDRYLIPQVNLVEVLHLDSVSDGLELAGDAAVFRLRGTLLPIIRLREVLGLESFDDTAGVSIVVLQAEGRQFGLVVDVINDTEEIVVKPLGPHLKSIEAFAGTTILGDGAVGLILDAVGIARRGGVVAQDERTSDDDGAARDAVRTEVTTVLACRVGDQRIAIPLSLVARLEEFDRTLVERAAGRDVIQYRGGLLNVHDLHELLVPGAAVRESSEEEPLRVVVYESETRTYGLVVDEVLDVSTPTCRTANRRLTPVSP